jgi:hypothetical protein
MNFLTIAEISVDQDRARFYFRLDAQFKPEFAVKQSLNGEISKCKADNIFDIFAWLGFTKIAHSLIHSEKFQSKYKTQIIPILNGEVLIVKNINDSAFMFKRGEEWQWTQEPADLIPPFGESIYSEISTAAGPNFIKDHISQAQQQRKLNNNIKETINEMKAVEAKSKTLEKRQEAEQSA